MIAGAAFVPAAPVLVPDVAQGAAPELAGLRAACTAAIRRVAGAAAVTIVIGSGPAWDEYESGAEGTLAGFGVDLTVGLSASPAPRSRGEAGSRPTGPGNGQGAGMPPDLVVGAWLARAALGPGVDLAARAVGPGDGRLSLPDTDVALVIVGDGSARRSEKAPGHFDARAEGVDAALADGLATGRLVLPDAQSAADLMVGGHRVWAACAPLLADVRWDADLGYADAPYGVGYMAASWVRAAAGPGS